MQKLLFRFYFILLLPSILLNAQTTKEEVLSDLRFAGGLYCPYYYTKFVPTQAPEGYNPFYISHYGRHGSRWVISSRCHIIPEKTLGEADKAGKLTELGKSLYERIQIVAEDARDRYGDLAPLGAEEEKEIAERMFRNFPEVFSTKDGRECNIYCRSTQSPRCILSMAANNERLKELNPDIKIIREASKRNNYLNNDANLNNDTVRTIVSDFLHKHLNPSRFITSIFTDTTYAYEHIDDPVEFIHLIFSAAIDLPDINYLKISLYDVFSDDEIFILWQSSNLGMYCRVGPSLVNGKRALKSAGLLLKDIIDCADSAINNKNISADLRFGHDTYIIPLLALMDIKGMNIKESDPEKVYKVWSDFKASPMGTNVQIIFYRHIKSNDILVKILFREKETEIPVKTDIAPYYHWKDVKAYYEKKIVISRI